MIRRFIEEYHEKLEEEFLFPRFEREGRLTDLVAVLRRQHEAREDTVLFPALREIVPARELLELGLQFEQREERQFGEHGFDRIVEQVADLERQLDIHDLAKLTP